MSHKNIENLDISSDAHRHLQPRLNLELMRAWRETEKRNRHPLKWGELIELFNAHSPNPYADEVHKCHTAIMAAAEIDKIRDQIVAALDARPVNHLYPSKKSHEAMRAALFDPKMASGGKQIYELFFRYLDLSESAGCVKRTYSKMLKVIEPAVASWPLGEKLAIQILEAGLKKDGLTFAQLKESIQNDKKTLGDARLEASSHPNTKFLFVIPTHHRSHA